jgi:eukaryotic-like serine/threonine-protein kinase
MEPTNGGESGRAGTPGNPGTPGDSTRPQIPGYQILERIGAGAVGAVYRARQISLNRVVAIKVIRARTSGGGGGGAGAMQKLVTEAKAAARLNHPNIVQAFDVGQAGNLYYFVMEYVQGESVFQRLQTRGRYEQREAAGLVKQVAQALLHAHEAGLVHCDVKPQNILVTPEGLAKLADLGLARSTMDGVHEPVGGRDARPTNSGGSELRGRPFGTPHYMSPEQARGAADIDARTDIYSLGVTFYHMVTGRVPFTAQTPREVMHKHQFERLVPPDQACSGVSLAVATVIEMMMDKDPAQRYENAGQLLADLEAVEGGGAPVYARQGEPLIDEAQLRGLESGTVSLPARRAPLWQASPLVVALLLALALLSAVLLVLLFRR